jgi:betaine-aldehyde dehydrogenase
LTISQEEIFGPVAAVMAFGDLEDGVRLANGTRYGLAASVWTRDLAKGHLAAAKIRAGAVQINNGPMPPNARLPWGGMKTSGIGRELSFSGIEACTEEKAVTVCLT